MRGGGPALAAARKLPSRKSVIPFPSVEKPEGCGQREEEGDGDVSSEVAAIRRLPKVPVALLHILAAAQGVVQQGHHVILLLHQLREAGTRNTVHE